MNKYVVRFKMSTYEHYILIDAENTIQAMKILMTEYVEEISKGTFEIIKISEVSEVNDSRKISVDEMIKSIKFNAETANKYYEENKTDYAHGIHTAYKNILRLIEKTEI